METMVPATEEAQIALQPLGLLGGEGELPLQVAQNARLKGYNLYVYSMDRRNLASYRRWISPDHIRSIRPGLMDQNFRLFHQDGIKKVVFAGKVNKWTLLTAPVLDGRALRMWRQQRQFNDDSIMLTIIRELHSEGIDVIPQTDFLQDLLIAPGLHTRRPPTEQEQQDITFGMDMAREMGRLDVGQTVVVCNQMVIAVEAIEGTDQAILRSRRCIGRRGGVVCKVEKPNQDLRFDVPTVGPRTLKHMKKAGLKVLAVQAGKTLVLEQEKLIAQANKWDMTMVAL